MDIALLTTLAEKAGIPIAVVAGWGLLLAIGKNVALAWIKVTQAKADESAKHRELLNKETRDLIESYSTQVTALRKHLDEVDASYARLRQRVIILEAVLRQNNIAIPT